MEINDSQQYITEQDGGDEADPIPQPKEKPAQGDTVQAIVDELSPLGAFVSVGAVKGFVNVTDLAWTRVSHPSDVFDIGDAIDAKVLSYDENTDRLVLGVKQLKDDPWRRAYSPTIEAATSGPVTSKAADVSTADDAVEFVEQQNSEIEIESESESESESGWNSSVIATDGNDDSALGSADQLADDDVLQDQSVNTDLTDKLTENQYAQSESKADWADNEKETALETSLDDAPDESLPYNLNEEAVKDLEGNLGEAAEVNLGEGRSADQEEDLEAEQTESLKEEAPVESAPEEQL